MIDLKMDKCNARRMASVKLRITQAFLAKKQLIICFCEHERVKH